MNGADSLVQTLIAGGVEVCFTNPGTSEMHLVAAFDRQNKIRCVLGLFEGVVTAAADGYARMAGKPACTLLHLGPGFANGLANLHNAWRAHSPIVNLIGQHAISHLAKDTPLNSDIEGIARPYAHWLRTSLSVSEVGRDVADAVVASRTPPGQIATLIVPANIAWETGGNAAAIPCYTDGAASRGRKYRPRGKDATVRIAHGYSALRKCALRPRPRGCRAYCCRHEGETACSLPVSRASSVALDARLLIVCHMSLNRRSNCSRNSVS